MTLPRLLAVSLLLALTTAAPAAATSCAATTGTPEQVLGGTSGQPGSRPLLERYDSAVVGTVTSIRSDEDGPTTLRVRLVGVVGRTTAPAELDVSSPDPGWINGYGFREGTSYFLPLRDRGEDGRPNASFLCDPISETTEPAALFRRLEVVARDLGAPTARAGTAEPSASLTVTASEGGLSPAPVLLAGGVGLAGLVGVTAFVLRRRADG